MNSLGHLELLLTDQESKWNEMNWIEFWKPLISCCYFNLKVKFIYLQTNIFIFILILFPKIIGKKTK